MSARSLIAVDIGNSRIKLGLFATTGLTALPAGTLPVPVATLDLNSREWLPADLAGWLSSHSTGEVRWVIGSVFRAATARLTGWIDATRPADTYRLLVGTELPLAIEVDYPERVGVDRLLAAVGANQLRDPARPAVVADLGSAITVDLVSAAGAFCGGAILPGIGMSARALCEQTDVLPHLPLTELDAPPAPLGRSTQTAIESGLFWGAVGAVREISTRLAQESTAEPHLFLTGGAAPSVAGLLGSTAQYEPYLVLAGIVLCEEANRCPPSPS